MTEERLSLDAERIIPDNHDGHYYRHLRNYIFAQRYSAGTQRVLDLGCGTGYGTILLARGAGEVIGVDYDADAIAYCNTHNKTANAQFRVMDCRRLDFEAESFDAVVSVQVIEHIAEWETMLGEVKRVLKKGGILVLTTPNRLTTQLQEASSQQLHYAFHVNEMDAKQLYDRLRAFFGSVTMFSMRRRGNGLYALLRRLDFFNLRLRIPPKFRGQLSSAVGVAWDSDSISSPDDFVVERRGLRPALNLIAVCYK